MSFQHRGINPCCQWHRLYWIGYLLMGNFWKKNRPCFITAACSQITYGTNLGLAASISRPYQRPTEIRFSLVQLLSIVLFATIRYTPYSSPNNELTLFQCLEAAAWATTRLASCALRRIQRSSRQSNRGGHNIRRHCYWESASTLPRGTEMVLPRRPRSIRAARISANWITTRWTDWYDLPEFSWLTQITHRFFRRTSYVFPQSVGRSGWATEGKYRTSDACLLRHLNSPGICIRLR